MKNDPASHIFQTGRSLAVIRAPAKRENAEQSMLFLLVGFAGSIIATRTFLEVTGYPQIATGDFHIAHVLWGGLLLFAASLLLLIWRGPNLFRLSSFLAGIGFGLFIDEVGKFITRTNDYFYPLAAPIIYGSFLFTVFIYSRLHGLRAGGSQAEVYAILNGLERGVDPQISQHELGQIKLRLSRMADQSVYSNVARLAGEALNFLEAENIQESPDRPVFSDRWRTQLASAQVHWLSPARMKAAILFGFILLGIRGALTTLATYLLATKVSDPAGWQQLALTPGYGGEPFGSPRLVLVFLGLTLESLTGGLLLIAAVLLLIRRLRPGLALGYWVLLFSLTAVQLLMYYFNQFDVLLTSLLQFSLLAGIIYYRAHFQPS